MLCRVLCFTQGVNYAILSPSILHLAKAYNTDLPGISSIYTSRSTGYLIGALFGCLLFRFMNRELVLSISYFLIASALLVLIHARNLMTAIIVMGVQGFMTGVCDSATNVIICQTWKEKASLYIQSLYFFFGLGHMLAPLMSAPFLDPQQFRIPYYITSIILFVSGVAFLPLVFMKRQNQNKVEREEQEEEVVDAPQTNISISVRVKQLLEWFGERNNYSTVVTVVLFTIMILSYSGMEIIYWEFVSAYLMETPFNILPEKASYMTAAFTYAFAVVRGLAIFVVWKVKPQVILFIDLSVLLAACVLILKSSSITSLWVGNILIGVAFATIYPQIFAYASSKIHITNYIGSMFVFASGATAVFLPKIVAQKIKEDHNSLIWLVFICSSITAAALFTVILSSMFWRKRTGRPISTIESNEEYEQITRL